MTWQDELRRLDEDMAAGRVSADDYRRRYDELTAQSRDPHSAAERSDTEHSAERSDTEAKTEADHDNTATGDQGSTAEQPKGDAGAGPFPPAFRWDNPSPNETTQVIQPVGEGDAERTQVVRAPAQPPPNPPYDDSERTQVVQVGPPAPAPYSQPPYQSGGLPTGGGQAGWAQQESAPPWVSSDLPPISEPNAGWMMQGPEFFEPENKQSGVGRIVAIAAAVVVLLIIGVGAFFLFRPSGADVAAPADTATQQPTTQPSPVATQPPGLPVAGLPGQVQDTSAVQDFGQLDQIGYLDQRELDVLSDAGASEAAFALSQDDGTKLIILVVQEQDAAAARDQLADLQVQFDLKTISGMPAGIRAAGDDNLASGNPVLRRAHYASGDYVVRVEASGNDVSSVQTLFQSILDSQLERLPVDG